MWRIRLLILFLFTFAKGDVTETKIVKLKQGEVRGYKDPEGDLFSFHGIPYATAPTGKNRFKGPLPAPIWVDTLDAVDKGIICPQTDLFGFTLKATQLENCLIANVFVPDTKKNKLSVVVYVHGGAYILGSGNFATYKNLVKSKKLIVVTFNYRLGPHGFLCLGTEDVPGNAGMKDQVALLRWVQKNIERFGGNPADVTIAGYSAGSSAVDLLMLSESAAGLFHKVIPESGSNTAAFSIQTDPLRNAKEYAKLLNFTNVDDFHALEEFYKTASYENLTAANVMSRPDSVFLMSPCIERKTNEEPFLSDSPVNILKSGNYNKLPMLYGFANMEGLFRISLFDQWKEEMNSDFSKFLPADLIFDSEDEKENVVKIIKEFYFEGKPITDDRVLEYIKFFTDVIFAYPTLRSVKLHLEAGHENIYLYEYAFVHEGNPVIPHTNVRGADHCAQTMALMDGTDIFNKSEATISQDYKLMKKIMRQIWVDFITTGKPITMESQLPDWPPVGSDWSPHMQLTLPVELKGTLLKKRALFWEGIYNKYYRQPSPPNPPKIKVEL